MFAIRFLSNSLQRKIGFMMTVLLAVIFLEAAGVLVMLRQQQSDSLVVNVAGRQRMLSQKITKCVLLIARGQNAPGDLEAAVNLFDKSLHGLMDGNAEMKLPAASAQMRPHLEALNQEWDLFRLAIETFRGASPGSAEYSTSLSYIIFSNEKILGLADKATGAFQAESEQKNGRLLIFLYFTAAIGFAVFGVVLVVLQRTVQPLKQMTAAATRIAQGDVSQEITINLHDEVGVLADAFRDMLVYLKEMTGTANQLAEGDLTAAVRPRSENDALGNAFARMVGNLRDLVGQVARSAASFSDAADTLASAARQADQATTQITATIQQMAGGTLQQAESAMRTATSVEQMSRAIGGVAQGAQEQALAVSKASQLTAQITNAARQVAANARLGIRDSIEAARAARSGAQTVEETIKGMENVKAKVGLSAQRVKEMGLRSAEIGAIVQTIGDIASQTNLLALNAAIEAARADGAGAKVSEQLLQQHLLGVADLLAELCARNARPLQSEELVALARRARVETLNITDANGVVTVSSEPGNIGFRFPEDKKEQAAVFRPLLKQRDGVVVQSAQPRSQDGSLYIYVGVSRRDQPGIVQAGMPATALEKGGNYTRGFAVVADEVRKLAEKAAAATKEIAGLIKRIQKTVNEAVLAMEEGAREVEARTGRAAEAGQALADILRATEAVNKQVDEIALAAQVVNASSDELMGAMDSVSAVVEENTAATEEMAANSTEVTQAVENIASVSEENSAAAEEVSAAVEAVSAQVQEVTTSAQSLNEMADALQALVLQFKLGREMAAVEIEVASDGGQPSAEPPSIAWDETMSSGIPRIDEQPQELIRVMVAPGAKHKSQPGLLGLPKNKPNSAQ